MRPPHIRHDGQEEVLRGQVRTIEAKQALGVVSSQRPCDIQDGAGDLFELRFPGGPETMISLLNTYFV